MQMSGEHLVKILEILQQIDVLIEGPFIEAEKDLSLKLRGSRNQHIRVKEGNYWVIQENG